MCHRRHFEEDERQKRKDKPLNEPDEDLEAKEGDGGDVRDKEGNDDEEHLPRENIAEETKGEGDHFREFCNQFEDPNEGADWIPERIHEELGGVRENAERGDAEDLGRNDRDQ